MLKNPFKRTPKVKKMDAMEIFFRQCEIDLAAAMAEDLTGERKQRVLAHVEAAQKDLDQKVRQS